MGSTVEKIINSSKIQVNLVSRKKLNKVKRHPVESSAILKSSSKSSAKLKIIQ